MARPSKFNEQHSAVAIALTRHGATQAQIAKELGVSSSTLTKWISDNEKFSASLKKARDDYDTGNVENALLKRAMGFSYVETKENYDSDGNLKKRETVEKYVPPDVVAIIYWLNNRNPERWRNVKAQDTEDGGEGALGKLVLEIRASKEDGNAEGNSEN